MADQILILQVRDNTTTRRDIGVETATVGEWAARVLDPDVLDEIQAVLAKLNAGLVVSATDLDIRDLDAATDSIEATQGTSPWVVSGTVAVTGTQTNALTDTELRASPVPVENAITTGTLNNGVETPVSGAAVSVLAANAARKAAIIQNVGTENVRIGVTGVSATTGVRLRPDRSLVFATPYIHTGAVFAIRETADSIVLAQEVV